MTENANPLDQIPPVEQFTAGVVVQKVNGQQFVKLQDYQSLVNLAKSLELNLHGLYEAFMQTETERDDKINSQAMHVALEVAKGAGITNADEAKQFLTAMYEHAVTLLNPADEYEDEVVPETPSQGPGDALDQLVTGSS